MSRFKTYLKDKDSNKVVYSLGMADIAELPKGDVIVKVEYSAVNEADVSIFTGADGVVSNYPKTPGIDASGIVVETTSKYFRVGDEVVVTGFGLGVNFEGSFSDYIRVPAEIATPVPSGTNLLESMILGSDGLTAAMASLRIMSDGSNSDKSIDKVLVVGATSTVGCIAIMMLKRMKFNIVAVSKYKDKEDFLKTLGADEVISINEYYEASKSRKYKFSAIIDTIGGESLKASLNLIRTGGTVVTTSFVNKKTIELDSSQLVSNLIDVFGVHSLFCDMDTKMYVWDQLSAYGDSKLLLWLLNEISLAELPAYIDFIKHGDINGRLVINHSL